MQEERKAPRRFSQAVAPPQNIPALNLAARDDAGGEPSTDHEGGDSAVIRVVLADSETTYRVVFRTAGDIRTASAPISDMPPFYACRATVGCHRRLRHETAQTATNGTRLSKIMPIL
jgi:hypothetical protein